MPNRTCSIDGCDRPHLARGLCHQHYKNATYQPVQRTLTCEQCGEEYARVGRRANSSRYCTPACSDAAEIARAGGYRGHHSRPSSCRIYYRMCLWCSKTFVARRESIDLCSDSCRREWRISTRDQRISAYRSKRTCPDCDAPLTLNQQRCESCRIKNEADYKQTEIYKAAQADAKRRRRARIKGARIESVKATEIYERDRWRCGICGKKVNAKLKWPNLMCASLDHIVPLAWGGEHSKANTQLAHFACNSMKGDRAEVQPSLFPIAG